MVKISDIRWGSYNTYEGPYYKGTCKLNLDCKNFVEKAFQVTSAAEGNLDSINMYDSALMTCGALQFIDRVPQFSICEMLGRIASTDEGLKLINDTLAPALRQSNATFKKNASGRWRFFLPGDVEVSSATLQQRLYFNGPNTKGTFTPDRIAYAKTWAMCMANLWQNSSAQKVQIDYTIKSLLQSYVVGDGKLLFDNEHESEGWIGAVRAAYISFSVNLPAIAAKFVGSSIKSSKFERYSPEWCLNVIHAMTFSGVKIWPQRYDNIRPELERLFGVTLPKNAVELQKRSWVSVAPPQAVKHVPDVAKTPPPQPTTVVEDVTPAPEPKPSPTPQQIVPVNDSNNMNIVYAIVTFINFIIAFVSKLLKK
jgi:hypothetical protein